MRDRALFGDQIGSRNSIYRALGKVWLERPRDDGAFLSKARKALDIDGSVQLVIPMVVVDQIDNLKRSKQLVRSRARQTASRLEACLSKRERVPVRRGETNMGGYLVPGPITSVEVLVDPLDHSRLADSDSEIVDRALYLRDLTGRPVLIATWDNLMRFRARGVGVETVKPAPEYEQKDGT